MDFFSRYQFGISWLGPKIFLNCPVKVRNIPYRNGRLIGFRISLHSYVPSMNLAKLHVFASHPSGICSGLLPTEGVKIFENYHLIIGGSFTSLLPIPVWYIPARAWDIPKLSCESSQYALWAFAHFTSAPVLLYLTPINHF